MGINFGNVTGGELNLRHRGNVIWNGNELMRMGGNGNVASHFRTVTGDQVYNVVVARGSV